MEIEFLLGKSKSGKSKYIYEKIKKDIDNGIEDILFVPSQKRAITEEQFMEELKIDGIIGADITTISSFVMEYLKDNNLNFESNRLSKLDKKLLLAKTVLDNQNVFNIFSNVCLKQGFLDNLYNYIDLFQKENININEYKSINLEDKILKTKLNEIVSIYELYLENLKSTFVNNTTEISIFKEIVKNDNDFKGKNIFFDGYNNFTNEELLFIDTLIKLGANITISLTTDITSVTDILSKNTNDIFEVSNKTYLRLLKICDNNNISVFNNVLYNNFSKANKSLKYLSENLFFREFKEKLDVKDNSINIFLKDNIYNEVRDIAKDISKKIREGYSYKDFVIYTTDIDGYNHVIKKIFDEYKIPYYIDYKKNIQNSKLCDYIKKLIDIYSNGLTYENAICILKLGLNDINQEEIYELENYIYQFNIGKNSLNKEIELNSTSSNDYIYDIEMLNNIRKKILNEFNEISSFNIKYNISDIIKKIYNHLLDKNIFLNYQNLKEKLGLKNEELSFEDQVYDKINEIYESIIKVYKDAEITFTQFRELFNLSLNEMHIKSIPPTLDSVSVVDINVSKLSPKKITYFVQVNENIFPRNAQEDIFFSDFELEKLNNKNIEFKETSLSRFNMEMYNIYEAISNTLETLNISILSSDTVGKALRPSSLITLIKQCLNIQIIGNVISEENNYYDIYSKEQVFNTLAFNIQNNQIEEKEVALYKYFNDDDKYSKILRYKKNDDNLSKRSIESIFGKNLTTSVSRLELFKKCPFSYFMQYSLNIKPRNEYQISSLDTGTFMHNVLEKFSKYLLENNIYWQSIIDKDEILSIEFVNLLQDIIDKELDNVLKKHKENIKYVILKQKLINTMKNVVIIIAKSFNQSEFKPLGYEIEFKDKGIIAPLSIKLNEDCYMNLIGKIDRVDILEDDDKSYIRVVDYKSSSKNLSIDDIREGLSLQLISYLTVLMQNYKEDKKLVLPAACVYFNLSDSLVNIQEYTNRKEDLKAEIINKLRLKGLFIKDIKILEKMDKKIDDKQNRMIDITNRSLNSSKRALEQEEFINLTKEVNDILKDIGNDMIKGVVKISPNKKADHCKYCKYISICRKDSLV